MSLRVKLFTAFISLIIIPLVLFGTVTFLVTSNLIEKKYSQQAEFSLKAISQTLSHVFKEMNNVTDSGIATNVFQNALHSPYPGKQDLTAADQLTLNAQQRNFRNLLYNHPAISFAYLYNFQGAGASSIVTIFTKEDFNTLPFDMFVKHPLYDEVMELDGVPKWIGPYEYPELTGKDPVFTQIRVIKELSDLRNLGILMVQIKNWEIERIFNDFRYNENLRDTRFFLVNHSGLILYDSENEHDGKPLQHFTPHQLQFGESYQSFKAKFDGKENVLSLYSMEGYGWTLVSATSWNSLSQEMIVFIKAGAVIMILCIVAASLFNLLFVNRITRSIVRIVRFMRRVENGEMNARVDQSGSDELYWLAKGFNSLITRINVLFEQVKREQSHKNKAEMQLLQAQINPHFLFNTLESINALAVQNDGKKVSQMVRRLGSILRISMQDRAEISVYEEIEHLRSYLEIQKYRFEDLFDYEIDIPEEAMNCGILKLTLQPLVENSIQHGFEGIEYKGMIRIMARREQDNLVFMIEDNGIGMSQETLVQFVYKLADEDESAAEITGTGGKRRGLGVRNVADRVRIHYGAGCGLWICSQQGHGTTIKCVIPFGQGG